MVFYINKQHGIKRGEIRKQAKTLGEKYDKALSAYKKKAGANK